MKIHLKRTGQHAGFSLAELMVVIVIIGLLSALIIPNILAKHFRAQVTTASADVNTLSSALDEFAINNANQYPDSMEILVMPDTNGMTYLKQRKLPLDPWRNPYVYEAPHTGQPRPRVISYGKDGAPGGEGTGLDIDNWPDND